MVIRNEKNSVKSETIDQQDVRRQESVPNLCESSSLVDISP